MAPHNLPGHPRILLVKLSSFGDVLHALPTLEALREAYPSAHLTWLVEAAYAPLLSGHPALDEVWIAPRLRPGEFFSGSNPARLRRLVQQLRSRAFDLVVDVQGLLKSAVWVALAKSPRKVGYDSDPGVQLSGPHRAGGRPLTPRPTRSGATSTWPTISGPPLPRPASAWDWTRPRIFQP